MFLIDGGKYSSWTGCTTVPEGHQYMSLFIEYFLYLSYIGHCYINVTIDVIPASSIAELNTELYICHSFIKYSVLNNDQ